MANIISMLKLEELSLVDNPANPLAMAPLYKRNSQEGENMTKEVNAPETVAKSEFDELAETLDCREKEAQMLRKALIENGFVIKADSVEKKAAMEYIEVEGEKINKADVPAAILKKMETDASEKRAMELTKRAEELLPNVKKDHAEALVQKFEVEIAGSEEDILEFLAAVDGLFAGQMEEVGKKEVDADMTDPDEKLEALVKVHMEDNKMAKKDYAKAYAAVAKTDEGKSLIAKSYKGDS